MKASSLLEVLCAAHLSNYVQGPFKSRGGIMLVAPPSHLKTSFISVLEEYNGTCIVSDINAKSLAPVLGDVVSGKIRTLGMWDFQKLYERHNAVSSNVEGIIRGMIDEGWTNNSWEDQTTGRLKARALFVSAMPYEFYLRKISEWKDSGFARRCLWCVYRLNDPDKLVESIHQWELLEYASGLNFSVPANKSIPYRLDEKESKKLEKMVRWQHDKVLPFILIKKIACVLKWRYSKIKDKDYMDVMDDFAECLNKIGAEVEL